MKNKIIDIKSAIEKGRFIVHVSNTGCPDCTGKPPENEEVYAFKTKEDAEGFISEIEHKYCVARSYPCEDKLH